MSVEATVLIDFGSLDPTGILVNIELDEERNLDEEGEVKTSFSPKDTIFFKVQFSTEVEIEDIIATDGTIQSFDQVPREKEEQNVFASRQEAAPDQLILFWIPSSAVQISYIGRTGILSTRQRSNKTREYTADIEATPFIAVFNYNYNCFSFSLETPDKVLDEDETYDIVIVLYVKESTEVSSGCSS